MPPHGTIRSDDIVADPTYGHSAPYHGMPKGHLPVRSYLAVPVVSPTSHEVLGGFYLILADSPETALRIGARQPGARFGSIEVRPLFDLSGIRE